MSIVIAAYDQYRSGGNESRREARKLLGNIPINSDLLAALLLAPAPPGKIEGMTQQQHLEWQRLYDDWFREVRNVALVRSVISMLMVITATTGCTGNYSDTPWVTPPSPTMIREHSGALGKALVSCVWKQREKPLHGYDLLWSQIILARGHHGEATEAEEIAQLCTTAAALAACQDNEDWKSLPDYQARFGDSGTCVRIVEAVDVRRDDTWAAVLAPRKELQ